MSHEIADHYARKFLAGINLLSQQLKSITRDTVTIVPDAAGEIMFRDAVGPVELVDKDGFAQDIPVLNQSHTRRALSPQDKWGRRYIDSFDKLKIFNDPTNRYSQAFTAAGQRAIDRFVITALLGTAYTGKQGTVPIALPTAQKIAAGSTGFTFAKVQEGIRMLRNKNAIMQGEPVTVLYTSFQEKEFVNTTEVKSIDYNTQKVLVEGEAGTFYTCHFKRIEDAAATTAGRMLPYSSSTRSCVMYPKSACELGLWKDVFGSIDWLPEKQVFQVMGGVSGGAVRLEDEKVVQIDCVE